MYAAVKGILGMGNVEDVRKVIQDFVAPDLKALEARISALEREMKAGFEHSEKVNLERFAHAEKMNQERFSQLEKQIATNQQTLLNTMSSNQTTIMNYLEMEKRLTRLEERGKAETQHA